MSEDRPPENSGRWLDPGPDVEPPPPPPAPAPGATSWLDSASGAPTAAPGSPLPPPPPGGLSPSTYLWGAGGFAAVLAAWFGGGILGAVVAAVAGFDVAGDPGGLAVSVVGQGMAALAVIVWISREKGTGSLQEDLGLHARFRQLPWILGGFVLQLVAALIVAPIIQYFVDDPDTQQQVAQLAEDTSDVGGRVLLALMFVVVAPFIEEVIFRGVMLSWLRRRLGSIWGVVISSATFAGVHLADPDAILAVPGLFIIGLGLGWAAVRYKGLGVPILLHAGVNLTATVALFWGEELIDWLERAAESAEAVVRLL